MKPSGLHPPPTTRPAAGGDPAQPGSAIRLCLLTLAFFLALPGPGNGRAEGPLVISGDTVWQGTVQMTDDVLVSETGHLNILPGTTVVVHPSEGTRTDPHFLSTETELMVRGKLSADGRAGAVIFRKAEGDGERWAGITADGPASSVSLAGVTISGATSGLTAIDAPVSLVDSIVLGCRYGVTLLGKASAVLAGSRLEKNEYGLADYSGGSRPEGVVVSGNTAADFLDRSALAGYRTPSWWRLPFRRYPTPGETEFLGEHSLAADTVWSGRIVIRGQVVIQPEATLTVQPGTEVAFRKLDTNGDGLGESQLLILGGLRVLGTPDNWVLFTSAEAEKKPGDWDKISLISSGSAENIVRHARFEYGYQAFHNHFSGARLEAVIFNDNYRGAQFQESPDTRIEGAWFTRNKSAMRFRDSNVTLSDCLVEENLSGVNYLRCRVRISDSAVTGNFLDPLLGRESETVLSGVVIIANREGPRFKGEGSKLEMNLSSVRRNLEDGLSMSHTRAELSGCDISANGLDGLSVTEGAVKIGQSSLAGNGRWALDNNGAAPVDARGVWWGTADPAAAEKSIYDGRRKPGVGLVDAGAPLSSPPGLFLAGSEPSGESWSGEITVVGDFSWPAGRTLTLAPGSAVRLRPLGGLSPLDCFRDHPHFPGSELMLQKSAVSAAGTADRPIRFEGSAGPSGLRGGVNVEQSPDARFVFCSFAGAATGLHLRESSGAVEHCRFEENEVGLRFHTTKLSVSNNLFLNNGAGVRFHFGEPAITGNLFRGNRTAIFISDDPGGYAITGNDFMDNTEYSVSLGEPVAADIRVPDNFWGTASEEDIEAGFFDRGKDANLGRVIYRPFAARPFPEPDVPAPAR